MQDQNFFSELDLAKLKTQAIVWFNQFQCIQEIFLYKSNDVFSNGPLKYIIAVVAPPRPELSQKERSTKNLAYGDLVRNYGSDRLEEALNNIRNPELRFKACTQSFHSMGVGYISDKLRSGVYKEFYKDPSIANIENWDIIPINDDPHCSFKGPDTILDLIDSKVQREVLFESPAILERRLMEKAKGLSDIDGFVKEATATGYIAKERLAHVLGYDGQYTSETLRKLWAEYALEGEVRPKEDNERKKIEAWYYILRRLTTGVDYRYVNLSWLSVLPLNHYAYVQKKLSYVKVDPDDETGAFIKLVDLERYFPEILNLPIPEKLFPQKVEHSSEVGLKVPLEEPEKKSVFKKKKMDIISHNEQIDSPATSLDLSTGIWISKNGTLNWEDIAVRVVNEFEIGFHPKGETYDIREFSDLGFGDRRRKNSVPIQPWRVLIQAIKNGGDIPYTEGPEGTRPKIEKIAQRLRRKLKVLFPETEGDPLPLNKKNLAYRLALTVKE